MLITSGYYFIIVVTQSGRSFKGGISKALGIPWGRWKGLGPISYLPQEKD